MSLTHRGSCIDGHVGRRVGVQHLPWFDGWSISMTVPMCCEPITAQLVASPTCNQQDGLLTVIAVTHRHWMKADGTICVLAGDVFQDQARREVTFYKKAGCYGADRHAPGSWWKVRMCSEVKGLESIGVFLSLTLCNF